MKNLIPMLVLLSASVQASEIDNLITTSSEIRATFDMGIKTIAGQATYAQKGGISVDGMAMDAYLSQSKAEAYNVALAKVSTMNTTISAQEYFDTQAERAFDNLDSAISTYIEASGQLISAVQINQMASEVATTESATELKTYVANNDLSITNEQVESYNESLSLVETAAQEAAAFTAIAADVTLVDSAQSQADALGQSFSFVEDSFYSQGAFTVQLQSGDIGLDVSGYLKTALDVLAMGEYSAFYDAGPTSNDCFFSTNKKCGD
jgi:hypothetical protein